MDNTAYVALSRQMALWKQMNTVSNNMANMNTVGYKQDDVIFTSFIKQTKGAEGIGASPIFFTQDYADFQNMLLPKEWVDLVELCYHFRKYCELSFLVLTLYQ